MTRRDFEIEIASRDAEHFEVDVLDNAVELFRASGGGRLLISGFSDSSGRSAVNMRVSEMRTRSAATYLSARGIPSTAIITEAFGETRPRVDTADGVREVQNRRVEITAID